MAIAKKMTQVTMQVMEALLGSDDLNDAMAEGLELLVNVLESTAGAIWVRDKEEDFTIIPRPSGTDRKTRKGNTSNENDAPNRRHRPCRRHDPVPLRRRSGNQMI